MDVRYQVVNSGGVFDFTTRTMVPPIQSSDAWQEYLAWVTQGNTALPPDDVIGQDDLPTSKAKRCSEIDAYAAGLRNKAVRGRSAAEMATWTAKLVEARAYTASSNATDAPLLNSIAAVRGIALADLVARVLAQSGPFLWVEAQIDGIRGKHCDAIDAMTDVRDIIVYDWHVGWPAI